MLILDQAPPVELGPSGGPPRVRDHAGPSPFLSGLRQSTESSDFGPAYSPELLPREHPYARQFLPCVPVYAEPMQYMASIQAFSRGGYEVVISMVDAQKMAERRFLEPRCGRRTPRPEEERDSRDIARAQFRAKKRVRHTVKEMAADRIVTLTTRESENTPDELLERWQRWLKLVERASRGRFHYVAVPEPHPSNPKHFHLHVAVAVFLNVDVLRRCWWAVCGGRGMGNIHIKRLKSGAGHRRVYRVASYISKYLTKENIVRFNRKRYWASRVDLPAVKRYWLRSRTLVDAVNEVVKRFRFQPETRGDYWVNEYAGIAWLQSPPGVGTDPPF
jgi:hypothetical protein